MLQLHLSGQAILLPTKVRIIRDLVVNVYENLSPDTLKVIKMTTFGASDENFVEITTLSIVSVLYIHIRGYSTMLTYAMRGTYSHQKVVSFGVCQIWDIYCPLCCGLPGEGACEIAIRDNATGFGSTNDTMDLQKKFGNIIFKMMSLYIGIWISRVFQGDHIS